MCYSFCFHLKNNLSMSCWTAYTIQLISFNLEGLGLSSPSRLNIPERYQYWIIVWCQSELLPVDFRGDGEVDLLTSEFRHQIPFLFTDMLCGINVHMLSGQSWSAIEHIAWGCLCKRLHLLVPQYYLVPDSMKEKSPKIIQDFFMLWLHFASGISIGPIDVSAHKIISQKFCFIVYIMIEIIKFTALKAWWYELLMLLSPFW